MLERWGNWRNAERLIHRGFRATNPKISVHFFGTSLAIDVREQPSAECRHRGIVRGQQAECVEVAAQRDDGAVLQFQEIGAQQVATLPFDEGECVVAGPVDRLERHSGKVMA